MALVQLPAALPGVESWSLESRTPQLSAVDWYSPRIALHPDGSSLAVGGPDGKIRVYDMFGGKAPRLTRLLIGHPSPIETLDWSPDGQWLASAEAASPSVRVWSLATGGCQAEGAAALNAIRCLRWSPDGRSIAVAGLGGACVLDAPSAEVIAPLDTHPDTFGLSWSPDASRVVASGVSCLHICDAASGERLHFIREPDSTGFTQTSIAWSPDGESVAYASLRGVWIWDPSSGRVKKNFIVPDLLGQNFPPITWVDNKSRLSIGTAHGTEIWDVVTGTKTADDPQLGFRGVRSANRRAVANLEYSTAEVTVYDSVSKKRRSVPMRSYFTAAAWSRDSRALAAAAGSPRPGIHLWTQGEAQKLEALPSRGVGNETALLNWLDGGSLLDAHGGTDVEVFSRGKEGWQSRLLGIGVSTWANRQPLAAVSADGSRLAYVAQPGDGKTVHILDVANGKSLRDVVEPDVQPAALALSPEGERLACFNTDGGLVIWETATGNRRRQAQLWPRDRFINEAFISWSPDGKQLAVSTPDGVVRLCDEQLNVRRELAGHDHGQASFGAKTMKWSGDGQTLQTADARKIRLWNTETGELLRATSHGLPRQAFEYEHINLWQFSSDQSRLVTTGSAARVWDAGTGRLQATLVDLRNGESAVVSPDGNYFATPKAESDLVYVVQTVDGQELLSPKEFAAKYGWKNDPARVSPPR